MLGGSEPGPETQQEMVELAKAAEREQEELRRLETWSQEREEREEQEEGRESEAASQEASPQASQEPPGAEEPGQPRPLSTQDVERHRASWPGIPGHGSEHASTCRTSTLTWSRTRPAAPRLRFLFLHLRAQGARSVFPSFSQFFPAAGLSSPEQP